MARAHAEVDAALRELDLEVASAFYDAMFAERSAELAQRSEDLARSASEVAERRRKAGEITDLAEKDRRLIADMALRMPEEGSEAERRNGASPRVRKTG